MAVPRRTAHALLASAALLTAAPVEATEVGKELPTKAVLEHTRSPRPSSAHGRALHAAPPPLGPAALQRKHAASRLRDLAGPSARLLLSPTMGHATRARGLSVAPPVRGAPRSSALAFLRAHAQAFGLPLAPREEWIRSDVTGAGGTRHVAFEQETGDGIPLYGAIVTVHTDADGAPRMVSSGADPEPDTHRPLDPISATEAVRRAGAAPGQARTRLVFFRPAGANGYRLAHQVDAGPIRSFVDAEDGSILERVDLRSYASAEAAVWDPNPLLPGTNVDDPAQTGRTRTLSALDTSGYLRPEPGGTVEVQDLEYAPARRAPLVSAADYLSYDPHDDGDWPQVEQLSIYYYLTETSSRLATLAGDGYALVSQHFPVVARVHIGEANAYFDPSDVSFSFGEGSFWAGIVNISRDMDVAAHEFGHLVEFSLAPDLAPRLNSPRRAIGEAFGDFTAAVASLAGPPGGATFRTDRAGTSCVGDSTIPVGITTRGCLRELKGTKRAPQDITGEEHDDGEIVGQALWSLSEHIAGGATEAEATPASLEEAYRVLLAGLPFLPRTEADYTDLADALLEGDAVRTGGAHRTAIESAFASHGLYAGSEPPVAGDPDEPQAEAEQSGPRGTPLPTAAGSSFTGSIADGETILFHVSVPPQTVRVEVAMASASKGDVDLYMAPASSSREEFEFYSTGAGADETVDTARVDLRVDGAAPFVPMETLYYVAVVGADVRAMSRLAGERQPFTLSVALDRPQVTQTASAASAGGGGCAHAPPSGLLSLVAAALALRRRR